MPRHPARDPSPSRLGPLPSLSAFPDDQPRGGRAPWTQQERHTSTSNKEVDPETGVSPLVFGGGAFGEGMYNSDDLIKSAEPVRALRLALRYGINTIDTSPYYYPSEFVIGRALTLLRPEFPRSSYFLTTKCGRYGPQVSDFDYSPSRVRSSIEASLRRLGTDYLDVALMHDVEFVAAQVGTSNAAGWDASAAAQKGAEGDAARASLGIASGDEARVRGPGDEIVLHAIRTLFELKDEGKIRRVGISGYPLPVLLRISRLVASSPPYRPLDVVLSYSNHTLHSDILPAFLDLFAHPPSAPLFKATPEPQISVGPLDQGENAPYVVDPSTLSPEWQRLASANAALAKASINGSSPGLEDSSLSRSRALLSPPDGSLTGPSSGESTPSLSSSVTSISSADGTPALSPALRSAVPPLTNGIASLSLDADAESPDARAHSQAVEGWKPPLVLNGSPFSMGLLTDAGPPTWHPASPELLQTCRTAVLDLSRAEVDHTDTSSKGGNNLSTTALMYGIRGSELRDEVTGRPVLRTLVGLSNVEQVHQAVQAYRVLCAGASSSDSAYAPLWSRYPDVPTSPSNSDAAPALAQADAAKDADETPSSRTSLGLAYARQERNEAAVLELMRASGVRNWSWASPPLDAYD